MSYEPTRYQSGIKDVEFGPDVKIIEPANLYGCKIGASTFVGPFVEVQRNVTIGKRCRIQSHTFICEGVTIDDDCFIGHGVMFVNDLLRDGTPNYTDQSSWGKTSIGAGCSIGSNATLLPVNLCPGTVIGAGSVVTKDTTQPGIYAGNPASFRRPLPNPAP